MKKEHFHNVNCGGGGAVYGLGFIGAIIYFFQHATSFSDGLLGVMKAILWPAFLVHRILEVLNF